MTSRDFFKILEKATILTASEAIEWVCDNYNPISYHERDPQWGQDSHLMHLFNVHADLDGETLRFEIAEYISLDTGKGDIVVEYFGRTDGYSLSLSAFQEYEACPAEDLLKMFQLTPIVRFVNSVLEKAVTKDTEVVLKTEYRSFLNEQNMLPEHLSYPMVKLALCLARDGRILDFHEAVLDMKERRRLMMLYNVL